MAKRTRGPGVQLPIGEDDVAGRRCDAHASKVVGGPEAVRLDTPSLDAVLLDNLDVELTCSGKAGWVAARTWYARLSH